MFTLATADLPAGTDAQPEPAMRSAVRMQHAKRRDRKSGATSERASMVWSETRI
jgi:hypothetical protein